MDTALSRPMVTNKSTEQIADTTSALDRFMPVLFLGSYIFAVVFLLATGLSLV
jgi:hypothetical protein